MDKDYEHMLRSNVEEAKELLNYVAVEVSRVFAMHTKALRTLAEKGIMNPDLIYPMLTAATTIQFKKKLDEYDTISAALVAMKAEMGEISIEGIKAELDDLANKSLAGDGSTPQSFDLNTLYGGF